MRTSGQRAGGLALLLIALGWLLSLAVYGLPAHPSDAWDDCPACARAP